MVALTSGRSQNARDGNTLILTCLKWSTAVALVCFFALAFYAQSSEKSEGTREKHETSYHAKHLAERERVFQSASAKDFVAENCKLGSEEWWPEVESWKRRTPAFLIIGAKKCGTTSLFHYLTKHPLIVKPRTKELLMFIPFRFKFWEKERNFDSKVLVEPARKFMYEQDYPVDAIRANSNTISLEATPDYVLYSTFSTKALLCTVPWIKIVITLRNPVDRLFSHYNFLKDPHLGRQDIQLTFEQWVRKDIASLQELNVIPSGNMSNEEFFGSKQEREAWRNYQRKTHGERYVSRSLYACQIEEWFEALRLIGRDPAECVLIVKEEDMKRDAQAVSNRIFKWLGMEPHIVDAENSVMVTSYGSKLSNETRLFLEEFLAPYNQRLYKLLGKDWEGIWDPSEADLESWRRQTTPKIPVPPTGPTTDPTIGTSTGSPTGTPKDTPKMYKTALAAEWSASNNSFFDRFCTLGLEKSLWPKEDASWKLRAPFFLIIGAKKASTSSIWRYFAQHPSVTPARTKELHTFQPTFMKQFQSESELGAKIRVDMLRQAMYSADYNASIPRIKANPNLVTFEATPDYLLYSTFSAQAILCAVPWVKIVVSLRNPIDRLFSHYNFIMDDRLMPERFVKVRQNVTFDEYVENDMAKLRSFGVIQDKIPQEEFFGSEAEKNAWRNYQKSRNNVGDRPVSRSLYAIQLEEWTAWLVKAGRDPSSEMLIMEQEEMKADSDKALNRIAEFLKLPPHKFNISKDIMVTHYTREMKPETREKLNAFFLPYNKRLYKVLGKEREGMWD